MFLQIFYVLTELSKTLKFYVSHLHVTYKFGHFLSADSLYTPVMTVVIKA